MKNPFTYFRRKRQAEEQVFQALKAVIRDLERQNAHLTGENSWLTKQVEYLRCQLMKVRVSQGTEGRRGWEVMAYIPDGVVGVLKTQTPEQRTKFVAEVAFRLVALALKGIFKVDSMGEINVLVFPAINMDGKPNADRWVKVLSTNANGEHALTVGGIINERPLLSEAEQLKKIVWDN